VLSLRMIAVPALALTMTATPSTAQVSDPPDFRVEVGLGLGGATHGLGGLAHVGVGTPIGDFLLRGAGGTEFHLFQSPESVGDIAVLYGRTARGRKGWARAGAGIGAVASVRRGAISECALLVVCKYDMITDRSAGLALQFDAVWAFSSPFGIGIGAFANINSAKSFGGGVVSLHFGRLR